MLEPSSTSVVQIFPSPFPLKSTGMHGDPASPVSNSCIPWEFYQPRCLTCNSKLSPNPKSSLQSACRRCMTCQGQQARAACHAYRALRAAHSLEVPSIPKSTAQESGEWALILPGTKVGCGRETSLKPSKSFGLGASTFRFFGLPFSRGRNGEHGPSVDCLLHTMVGRSRSTDSTAYTSE